MDCFLKPENALDFDRLLVHSGFVRASAADAAADWRHCRVS
jgi:hypothetical protein